MSACVRVRVCMRGCACVCVDLFQGDRMLCLMSCVKTHVIMVNRT